ncbi:MarR family transcriptional regulator [Herbihabitans rhizosphaerae]|uniref:MarR family transcriptional regulator n=1 Tax=Herbihabitans rhizosphaerae TaxID=1872711 RepID=A0A4Q7KMQ3_9PSEU|nr:MarR family transcriptional regulator [Herbihabitans rhizosphaerae]RZS36482.1 MarR family transcriptional regulator [Herbihabitans rhizosphaerae]
MHDNERLANLLGATALAVTDLTVGGATRAAGVSASGAAALVVLNAAPGVSVTELGRRVGLTQSAAARMVDSLESDGLVERRPGIGRGVAVRLTRPGRRAAQAVLDARGSPLTEVLDGLDGDDQVALTRLLERLLSVLYNEIGDSDLICRLCDRGVCTTGSNCPVGEAERASR